MSFISLPLKDHCFKVCCLFVVIYVIVVYHRRHIFRNAFANTIPIPTTLQDETPSSTNWIKVDKDMFIYSGFYDPQQKPQYIRMIGVTVRSSRQNYTCLLFDSSSKQISQVQAKVSIIGEHHNERYAAAFILCEVGKRTLPHSITLKRVETHATKKLNKTRDDLTSTSGYTDSVRVVQLHPRNVKYNFTVCVAPLHGKTDAKHLIVWLELNLLMGADHFIFYIYKTADDIINVLEHYKSRGLVEIFRWSLDTSLLRSIHYFGQLASINDCIYRSRHVARYVAIIDRDETIVSQNISDFTWVDLFRRFPQNKYGSFMFRNTFSPLRSLNDTFITDVKKRCENIDEPKSRSKVIVVPHFVNTGGIHFVQLHDSKKNVFLVPPSFALLHHYRLGLPPSYKCPKYVEFDVLKRYKDRLWKNVHDNLNSLKEITSTN